MWLLSQWKEMEIITLLKKIMKMQKEKHKTESKMHISEVLQRSKLKVWFRGSRERLGRGEDEKAAWCTSGHSSTGTWLCSSNFYSHMKNIPRHKNANNSPSLLSCLRAESLEEEQEEIQIIQRDPNPNCPEEQQGLVNLDWRKTSNIPGAVQRISREMHKLFCNCKIKSVAKPSTCISAPGLHQLETFHSLFKFS